MDDQTQFRGKCGKRGRDRFFGVKKGSHIRERVWKRGMGKIERRWSLQNSNFMDFERRHHQETRALPFSLLPTHWCFISCWIDLLAFCLSGNGINVLCCCSTSDNGFLAPLPSGISFVVTDHKMRFSKWDREAERENGWGMEWTLYFPRSCKSISSWWENAMMSERRDH